MQDQAKGLYWYGDLATCPRCGEESLEYSTADDSWRCVNKECGYEEA
ncbi:MAG: hypothetical protein KGI00_03155 [Candidatus Micrarchaeota archaeon]|nr:hypothetical protein [Candidatus Micrarchaeota archaeon]MDE1824638.1 hypothetical protein [Candidatus Micrarchaeota archaeon]MDE1849703.1 hypothetical protein [Candidatus Micrarchaeota archaeon]